MTGAVDLAVVGGGAAGLSCATAAAVAGLTVVVVEREAPGGQLTTVGTVDGRSGADLAADLLDAAVDAGVDFHYDAAVALSDRTVAFVDGAVLHAATVVLATGSRVDLERLPGAAVRLGRGVSVCASCDGPLFRGRAVAVVGTGRDAASEAADLTPYATTVTLVDPSDAVGVTGDPVDGLVLRNGETLAVQGVFVAGPRRPVRLDGAPVVIGDARPGTTWTLAGAIADGVDAAHALLPARQSP